METGAGAKRVKSFVRGYHEYNEIWEPEICQEAILKREAKTNGTADTRSTSLIIFLSPCFEMRDKLI